MALKTFKPTSAGLRHVVIVDRSELHKGKPVKELTEGLKKSGGRNNYGRLVSFRKGGGHKRRYRLIDFKRRKFDMPAVVERLEYDPNRTAHLALVLYKDGERRYILAPKGVKAGDEIRSGSDAPIKAGNSMALRHIPVGSTIHNIELKVGHGGQLARSAGASAQFAAREGMYGTVRLKSGEMRKVHIDCRATIGEVGNAEHFNINLGKAGRRRRRRPGNRRRGSG